MADYLSPTTPASIHGSVYSMTTMPPEVITVNETLAAMKGSLGSIGVRIHDVTREIGVLTRNVS